MNTDSAVLPTFSVPVLIQKKRDGIPLTHDEIRNFVMGASRGEIPDYQITAFLMATFFSGMNSDETATLTQAMVESGEKYDLSEIKGPKIDMHSTVAVTSRRE